MGPNDHSACVTRKNPVGMETGAPEFRIDLRPMNFMK